MLVGTKRIDINQLREAIETRHKLEKYIANLVPPILSHIPEVWDNQRYLVALYIRNLKGVNFNHKTNIVTEIIDKVNVQGSINNVYDLDDILVECDMDKLLRALYEDELNEYKQKVKHVTE